MISELASLWTANGPDVWPDAPTEMTVTALAEIEACPRRWALGVANYPALWAGRGYPPRVQANLLEGSVVHLALEAITKGFARAGCPSVQDPTALRVLKELGGYTKVVNNCIDQVIHRLAGSPRAKRALEFAARFLCERVPALRMRVQTILCRVRLPQVGDSYTHDQSSKTRSPLSLGLFPEIELRARQLSWKGRADFLVLSPGSCEIIDFKTGAQDDKHKFQIQVYALLWSRDNELNPGRRIANRLILAYSNGNVEVSAPTTNELDALESSIVARSESARESVSQHPPEARPNPVHCKNCSVRQLCDEYWKADTQSRIAEKLRDNEFADLEVIISGRHGPSSWDAVVVCSSIVKRGQLIMVRADDPPFELRVGQQLRLLSVHMSILDKQTIEEGQSTAIATLGILSEAFIVLD